MLLAAARLVNPRLFLSAAARRDPIVLQTT
jgi:hypothetical protein